MPDTSILSRRLFLQVAASAPLIKGHGQIRPPLAVPDVDLVLHTGMRNHLIPLVTGRVTAVQLMFTECTTTCPMGAATFQKVQRLVPDMGKRGMELLSLSIDPKNDTAQAMEAWRKRFNAGPNWLAAAPTEADFPKVEGFFRKGSDFADHSTQVHILDKSGRLVWRTYELPAAEEIVNVLERV